MKTRYFEVGGHVFCMMIGYSRKLALDNALMVLYAQATAGQATALFHAAVVSYEGQGMATVYESPWSGKTPCYRNVCRPLGGIVLLSQAPYYNKIRRLGGMEAYADLVPSISGKLWDRYIADGLHQTGNGLAKTVSVWYLECLPDEEAARVCTLNVGGDDN